MLTESNWSATFREEGTVEEGETVVELALGAIDVVLDTDMAVLPQAARVAAGSIVAARVRRVRRVIGCVDAIICSFSCCCDITQVARVEVYMSAHTVSRLDMSSGEDFLCR